MRTLSIMLLTYAVYATEECTAGTYKLPVQCYECTSKNGNYCDDPFNTSHPDIAIKTCAGACTKWVKKPKSGPMSYIRTCSSRLKLRMPISHVCMMESRPGDGYLCFCGRDHCNHGNSFHGNSSSLLPFLLLLLALGIVSDRLLSLLGALPKFCYASQNFFASVAYLCGHPIPAAHARQRKKNEIETG